MTLPDPHDFVNRKANTPIPLDYDLEDLENLQMDGPNPKDYRRDAIQTPTTLPQPALSSPDAIRESIADIQNFHQGSVINPYQLGKEQPFGAGLHHHQYERYYEHPAFNQLGFSPFRDNETFYNEKTSGWHDFQRAVGEWGTLAKLGFKDAAGFGDLTDIENAREYEKAMAIGQSTRGGFAGFSTNLYLNSGYTVGIFGEVALEELALAAVTGLSLGTASEVTVPLMVSRGARAFSKVRNAWKAGTNIIKTLDNLKDINRARVYMRNATRAVGNVVNPLEQTTSFIKGYKKLDNLSLMAKTSLGVGSFYRDIRNIRLVWSEAGLEGGMVQNQLEQELLAEHYDKYDRPPTDEEAERIRTTASQAGVSTALWNMPTIFFTNKIVLENLMRSSNPVRRLTTDVVTEGAGGKIVKTGAKTSPFQVVENNFKGFVKGLKNPKSYARTGLNYFKANFAEGIQESAQEIISGSVMDYYKENFGSTIRGGAWSHIGENIQKQFSTEGAEIFFSGFLMGGMVQPITKMPGYVRNGFSRIKDSEGYAKMKQDRIDYMNRTVNMLNDMYDDPAKYLAPDMENLVAQNKYQKGMDEASDNGDLKSYHDLRDASVFQHVITSLQLGRMDNFIERLESLKDLNETEVKEAFPFTDDYEGFTQGIDNAVSRAREIQKRYDAMKKKHPNPFNPSQFKYNSDGYQAEYLNHLAYEKAIQSSIFMQYSFDRTLERMNALQSEIKDDAKLKNVPASDFNILMTIEDTQNEISQLRKELEVLGDEQLTAETRKFRKDKEKKLKLLEDFSDKMSSYLSLVDTIDEKSKEKAQEKVDNVGSRPVEVQSAKERKAVNALYKSYNNYLKHLAKVNKDHAFDTDLSASFQKLLDFYNLDDDAQKLTEAVNTLTDPGGFSRHAERIAEVMQNEHINRKAKIQQLLDDYLKMKDTNELLIVLHQQGMFFDPEQLNDLLENGVLPDKFYYAEAVGKEKGKLDEVLETSADYQKALDIVSKFVEHVMNKPIPERVASPYDTHIRYKKGTDNRTYDDYAEQFGFNPKSSQTVVPLSNVLQAIVDSKYSTYRDKALARRLLALARDTETVTFKKNMSVPGEYTDLGQTSVDARYASEDFNGDAPLEAVILHQEIHRRTAESLEKDNKFRADVKALYDHVLKHLETADTQRLTKPAQGLASMEEFIAEAMTNDSFQRFLAEIPYEGTVGASSWSEFIDSVVRMLQRFFGRKSTNTALNAAVDITTMQIEKEFGAETAARKERKAHAGEPKVSASNVMNYITGSDLSPAQLKLQGDILQAYKDFNAARQQRAETLADPNWESKSDEELLKDSSFKAYATGGIFSAVTKAIKEFNQTTGRTAAPVVEKAEEEGQKTVKIPLFITRQMKATLKERGYDDTDIGKMTPRQAHELIDSGITKSDIEAAREADIEAMQKELTEQRESVRRDIDTTMNNVENFQDFERAEEVIISIVNDPELFQASGYTVEEIEALLEAKKRDLAFTTTFEDLKEGEVVIMNDKMATRMVVEKKTSNKVKFHKIDDVTFTRTVKASKVPEQVKYRYSKAMEELGVTPEEVSAREQDLSNQDVNTAQSLNNQEAIQQDIEQAKQMSDKEVDDDFLKDIAKCNKP